MSSPADTLPNYEQHLLHVLNDWEIFHAGAMELYSLQVKLLDKQVQLDNAMRTLSKLKQKSAAEFTQTHEKKGGILGRLSFGKPKNQSQAEKDAQATFEKSHSEERQQAEVVNELQNTVKALTSKRDAVIEQAASSDKLWTTLQSGGQGRILGSEEIDAEETLQRRDADVEEAQKQVAALSRARLAIQHAHKYFSDALKVCDNLNPGSKAGLLSEGIGGDLVNMSKQNDYKAAIRHSEKSQSCLDECIHCLEPYQYTIPDEYAADYEALKASGVTQIKRIYDLMYEGKPAGANVRDSVKLMLERQEDVFKQLTRVAVWTQARVPECEIAENQAKMRREEARGQLAALWKKA